MKEIVLATNNKGKVKEYEEMLSPLGYRILLCKDFPNYIEPEENGTTYAENAYTKAKALRALTQLPVLADDSGLEVNALGKHPGLHSSRFAKQCGGNENARWEIIRQLEGKERSAQFVCNICYLPENSAKPLFFEGICPGTILFEPHGDNGFGYDPIFHSTEADIDFGIADEDTKNRFSHRGKALQKLVKALQE